MEGILREDMLGPRGFPKGLTLTIEHLPVYEKKKMSICIIHLYEL